MAFKLISYAPGLIPPEMPIGRRKQYRNALRKAVKELLGPEASEVRIFDAKNRLVAVCNLQRRNVRGGQKYSVVCSGEKPAKKARR